MHDGSKPHGLSGSPQTAFQSAVSDVLAQRLEAVALEVRATGTTNAGIFASGETLGMLAVVLQGTLRKIDEVFEFDGFVFTPACSLLLELFQARTRGGTIAHGALCQSVNCPASVAGRWINVLVSMQLVEKFGEGDAPELKVALTERGHLKTMAALQLLM
ncbi:hypothetical protein [Porphyrobacter sp. AAP60]|uniref:hypothetical protein n=1 Tax=Porphyrobacter sp. AAP60 TaxID=1523423 RepID=UPI001F1E498E|nr:hypothetical protein [Porphyrobacter sp. AAP60]